MRLFWNAGKGVIACCTSAVLAAMLIMSATTASAEKIGCGDVRGEIDADGIPAEQVQRMLQERQTFVLLDVREPEEFAEGHIDGAVNVPRGQIIFRIPEVVTDTAERIVVYCRTSPRSIDAARTLRQMGYADVTCMTGGFEAWQACTSGAARQQKDS